MIVITEEPGKKAKVVITAPDGSSTKDATKVDKKQVGNKTITTIDLPP